MKPEKISRVAEKLLNLLLSRKKYNELDSYLGNSEDTNIFFRNSSSSLPDGGPPPLFLSPSSSSSSSSTSYSSSSPPFSSSFSPPPPPPLPFSSDSSASLFFSVAGLRSLPEGSAMRVGEKGQVFYAHCWARLVPESWLGAYILSFFSFLFSQYFRGFTLPALDIPNPRICGKTRSFSFKLFASQRRARMASRPAISSPKSKSGAQACSTGAVETLWMREGEEGEEEEEDAKEREQEELRKTSDWGREETRKGRGRGDGNRGRK